MRTPLAVVFCLALAPSLAWGQSDERAAMRAWINADRAAEGRPALGADRRLDAVAEAHAQDMADHHFFSHTSPTTGAPADRATAAGISFRMLAENIALNQSVRAAHEALMRSPGHRANLLHGGLRRVGIGLARGPDGIYVTQLFATLPGDTGTTSPAAPPDDADDLDSPDDADHTAALPAPPDARPPTPPRATPRVPTTLPALPPRIDPRLLAAVLAEAQRRAEAFARPSARRRPGRWNVPTPFERPRLPTTALPWDDSDNGDDGDEEAPCAR